MEARASSEVLGFGGMVSREGDVKEHDGARFINGRENEGGRGKERKGKGKKERKKKWARREI